MRLACITCDRTDADGVDTPPTGWIDVAQLWGPTTESIWWTHLGTCPECYGIGYRRRIRQIVDAAKENLTNAIAELDKPPIE